MFRHPRLVAALAVLVVLAGCVAPAHDGTTGTETDDSIAVEGAGLPVDPDRVFDRVTRLAGAKNVTSPGSVRVVTPDDQPGSDDGSAGFDPAPAFFEIMGVDSGGGLNASEAAALENGRTNLGTGSLTVYTGANDSRTVHYVLAHEFVHYLQADRDRLEQLRQHLNATTDDRFVVASLLEGAAVYTTDAYIEAHLPESGPNSDLYVRVRERLAPGSFPAYANSRYIAGWRYVSARATAPNATGAIFANPPRTGEQVIHGLAPSAEPPRPLSVSVNTTARRIGTDRLGEGFLRIALRNGLGRDRAHGAAAGWGNDSLRIYRHGAGNATYVWALRFDDARNRTEFATALRGTFDARGTRTDGDWTIDGRAFDLRTVGTDGAVVLVGDPSVVANAAASGTGRNVSVTLPT